MKIRISKVHSFAEFEFEFPDTQTCFEFVGNFYDACTEDIEITFEKEVKEEDEDGDTI